MLCLTAAARQQAELMGGHELGHSQEQERWVQLPMLPLGRDPDIWLELGLPAHIAGSVEAGGLEMPVLSE